MEQRDLWVLAGVQGLLLLPFLLLCFFLWPSADDYVLGYLVQTQDASLWQVATELYMTWSGRYSTLAGAMLSPMAVNHIGVYRILIALTFVLLYLSVVWCMAGLFPGKSSRPWVWAGTFLLLWLQGVPGVNESFFWFSGVVVYVWPLIIFFFVTGALVRRNPSAASLIVVSIALFVMTGFNELAAVLALVVALLPLFSSSGRDYRKKHIGGLVAVAMGMMLLLLSPGNLARMEFFEEGRQLMPALRITLVSWMKLNGIHVQSVPVWLVGVMIWSRVHRNDIPQALQKWMSPLRILVFGQGLLMVLLFIPSWSMGIQPPLRVYAFLSPLWLLWMLAMLFSLRIRYAEKYTMALPGKGTLRMLMWITVVSLMGNFVKIPGGEWVFGGNIPRAWYDVVVRAPHYNEAMLHRESLIAKTHEENRRTLEVPPLKKVPGTIFFLDITTDPHHWINLSYARHYGLDAIWLAGEE